MKKSGSVILELVKCGKSNCHCVSGKKHKAYYLYFYNRNNDGKLKLKKEYVKKTEVKKLRQRILYAKNRRFFYHNFLKNGSLKSNFPNLLFYADEQEMLQKPLPQWYKRLHILLQKANSNLPDICKTKFKVQYNLKPFTLSAIPSISILIDPSYKDKVKESKRKLAEIKKMLS